MIEVYNKVTLQNVNRLGEKKAWVTERLREPEYVNSML